MKRSEVKIESAFSLIELLFVIGLIMFLTAVSMPITLGFFNDQVLDESATALRNNVKAARSKAMAGRGSGFWGIKIEEDKYILFEGKSFSDRNKASDIPVDLPARLTFSDPGKEIVFEKDSGKPFYDPSLVGHWKMNAGTGCTSYDYSGLGNHGLLQPDCDSNSPTWVEDKDDNSGQALEFDGEDDYIDAGKDTSLQIIYKGLSISLWIKSTENDSNKGIVSRDSSSTDKKRLYGVDSQAAHDKDLRFLISDDGENLTEVSTSDNAFDDSWHHFVGLWDGEEIKAYLDGDIVGTTTFTGPIYNNTSVPLAIGSRADFSSNFDGIISNVRIYDRALSEEEVQRLYEGTNNEVTLNANDKSVTLEIDEQGNVKVN